jgi:hypothetical protein
VKEDSMRPPLQRVLIVLMMVIVFLAGAAWANAQRQPLTSPLDPTVLSGSDIGFRMIGRKGNTVVGALVVRVNGEWIPAESAYGVKPVIK